MAPNPETTAEEKIVPGSSVIVESVYDLDRFTMDAKEEQDIFVAAKKKFIAQLHRLYCYLVPTVLHQPVPSQVGHVWNDLLETQQLFPEFLNQLTRHLANHKHCPPFTKLQQKVALFEVLSQRITDAIEKAMPGSLQMILPSESEQDTVRLILALERHLYGQHRQMVETIFKDINQRIANSSVKYSLQAEKRIYELALKMANYLLRRDLVEYHLNEDARATQALQTWASKFNHKDSQYPDEHYAFNDLGNLIAHYAYLQLNDNQDPDLSNPEGLSILQVLKAVYLLQREEGAVAYGQTLAAWVNLVCGIWSGDLVEIYEELEKKVSIAVKDAAVPYSDELLSTLILEQLQYLVAVKGNADECYESMVINILQALTQRAQHLSHEVFQSLSKDPIFQQICTGNKTGAGILPALTVCVVQVLIKHNVGSWSEAVKHPKMQGAILTKANQLFEQSTKDKLASISTAPSPNKR